MRSNFPFYHTQQRRASTVSGSRLIDSHSFIFEKFNKLNKFVSYFTDIFTENNIADKTVYSTIVTME